MSEVINKRTLKNRRAIFTPISTLKLFDKTSFKMTSFCIYRTPNTFSIVYRSIRNQCPFSFLSLGEFTVPPPLVCVELAVHLIRI